ncbi:MAG: hypothetical protein HUJ56_09730 [Erysipelotrichaceae bacterium]|nr:hypothetical protein [Erysipelotrichaceae bacterium]
MTPTPSYRHTTVIPAGLAVVSKTTASKKIAELTGLTDMAAIKLCKNYPGGFSLNDNALISDYIPWVN